METTIPTGVTTITLPIETSTPSLTCSYNYANDKRSQALDVFLPDVTVTGSGATHRPAMIYFHGGGLTVGNRRSWFPSWLQKRLTCQGCFFIAADYRLIPPSNGHDIVEDIQEVFDFVANKLNDVFDRNTAQNNSTSLVTKCRIDSQAIGVAGTSAGGLCAYLAAIHAYPKPRVLLSMYGMGGDFFTPHYLQPKSEPFLRGREILDPADFPTFLYPDIVALSPTSDSPLTYHPSTYRIPGYPSNPRMLLGRLYLQLGTFLDYYTGEHEPSLSAALRSALNSPERPYRKVPERHEKLFPQLVVDKTVDWPPTCLVHGSSDTAVRISESRNMQRLLEEKGVETEFLEVDGKEHSFDYEPNAEETHKALFDRVVWFLLNHLR